MSLLRAFIAIEIPHSILDAIQKETAALQRAVGAAVRWVPCPNLHLTLKFLGDVSPANLDLLTQMLAAEAAAHRPFDLQVGGLGSFPTPRRPRVIWIGLSAPAALESLQRGIEAASARLGYAAEDKPFSPHLTIGRVKQQAASAELQAIRAALEKTKIGDLGAARVETVHLFKSDLRPTGAEYTRLFSAPLGAT
ncbi:MAG: RNA 2',3'-cyclic phosphodiesterase [Chloroflexota bacterium]